MATVISGETQISHDALYFSLTASMSSFYSTDFLSSNYGKDLVVHMYCVGILSNQAISLPRGLMLTTYNNLKEGILGYFNAGYIYRKILSFLESIYGVFMTIRSLRYLLNKVYGAHRRGNCSPDWLIRFAIRFMMQVLQKKYDLRASRDQVMMLSRHIDPKGCASPKRRRLSWYIYRCPGANGTWHLDGYDKMKSFGFCITGCIDGYSRRVMFLEVASSNNDPKIIAEYYLECVKEVGGCPRLVQTDCGIENGYYCQFAISLPWARPGPVFRTQKP